jgi:hypothetical protein
MHRDQTTFLLQLLHHQKTVHRVEPGVRAGDDHVGVYAQAAHFHAIHLHHDLHAPLRVLAARHRFDLTLQFDLVRDDLFQRIVERIHLAFAFMARRLAPRVVAVHDDDACARLAVHRRARLQIDQPIGS